MLLLLLVSGLGDHKRKTAEVGGPSALWPEEPKGAEEGTQVCCHIPLSCFSRLCYDGAQGVESSSPEFESRFFSVCCMSLGWSPNLPNWNNSGSFRGQLCT
jgi:hypothetical protein